jgi:outer membrane lipoprotein LolB
MSWGKGLAGLALGGMLAACSTLPAERGAPEPFDLLGRVLVNYDGRSFSSNLRWQHDAEHDELSLMTPTGQTLAHLVDGADGATLTAADKNVYRARSAESLIRSGLGWEMPVTRLQYWVRGRIAPGAPPSAIERDDQQRISTLTQDGWRIVYQYYPPEESGGLPRRLELSNGTHEIRLVIDSWRPAEAP